MIPRSLIAASPSNTLWGPRVAISEKETVIRIHHFFALILVLVLAGCSAPEDDFQMPVFPAEKTVADFPGMTYPLQPGGPARSSSASGPVWLVGIDGITWDRCSR